MKNISILKLWTNSYSEIKRSIEDLQVLLDFYQEDEATEEEVTKQYEKTVQQIESLEFKNMLGAEEDSLGAILRINSGAGGTESQDWAEMLMRMYIRWGERNDYKVKEISYLAGEAKCLCECICVMVNVKNIM